MHGAFTVEHASTPTLVSLIKRARPINILECFRVVLLVYTLAGKATSTQASSGWHEHS